MKNDAKKLSFTILSPKFDTIQPIPLFLSSVRAGFPSPADDFLEKPLDLNEHLIQHPAATFFVRVDGDSMKNAYIHRGDILIVDRSLEATNGRIVIAVLNGEFTVKRLHFKNDSIVLESEHPNYPAIPISKDSDFQIWGVVTYIIHPAI